MVLLQKIFAKKQWAELSLWYQNFIKHKKATENVACCQNSAYSPFCLHDGLMQSSSHRGAILDSKYTHIAIAIIHGDDGYSYIVEEFYG